MGKCKNLTGQKFGRLTVVERVENSVSPKGYSQTRWLCLCECGNFKVVDRGNLIKGNTKSCGCLSIENRKTVGVKHGKRYTRPYRIWSGMKDRCYNEESKYYANYGGRGITVCDEWLHDFQSFYEWAIAHGYADCLSLDRKDNDKGYFPDNCRWATALIQSNNKRNNRLITFEGKTQSVAQWAKEKNIKYNTLMRRIIDYHWTIERALNTP